MRNTETGEWPTRELEVVADAYLDRAADRQAPPWLREGDREMAARAICELLNRGGSVLAGPLARSLERLDEDVDQSYREDWDDYCWSYQLDGMDSYRNYILRKSAR